MSLKTQMAADISAVFFNADEFAETVRRGGDRSYFFRSQDEDTSESRTLA